MSTRNSLRSIAVALALTAAPGLALGQGLEDPIPGGIQEGNIKAQLVTVATGLTAPNFGANAPGLPGYLFVTDQHGILWAIDLASGGKSAFLDVSGLIVPLGARPAVGLIFDERGLIGVAFHPDFQSNGKFYTFTSEPIGEPADFAIDADLDEETQAMFDIMGVTYPNHQSVITEWQANDSGNPAAGTNPDSRRVLMRIDQPQFNHNSGAINFGPDGMLYATIGDGGGADDPPESDRQGFIGVPILGHGLTGNGQNPGTIMGNIIRIDPDGDNSPNGEYGVPDDNPFFVGDEPTAGGAAGCADDVCDEIYAYGFRNPFRFSFDSASGILFVADVGQNDIEEVSVGVSGGNYGWRIKEGTFLFDNNGPGDAFVTRDSLGVPPGTIDPIAQYDHNEGVAVVGGFVYRGNEIGGLFGHYVFGEFAEPPFSPFSPNCFGRVFFLNEKIKTQDTAEIVANELDGELREFPGDIAAGTCILGFGQDAAGEIYVMGNNTGLPFGDAGVVMKLVAAP